MRFGRSCSDICHVSNKPAVLCFPWKSPQTPQCHWSLAGRGRQASPRRPGFHNRGRESCWQGSPRGQESKEVDYGGGGATGALLAVPPECWRNPHRRLLCWEWGRKILGRWGAVDLKWWRKSTGFFQNRSMKADFEGFLQGKVSFATTCQRLQSDLNAGNYRTFGFFNLVSKSFSNEDIADKNKLVHGPTYQ